MNNKSIRCLFALGFLVFGLVVLPACSKNQSAPFVSAGKTLYHCAMHPQIVSDKPGECPICHMRLIPINPNTSASTHKLLLYRNPMNPSVTSPVPMKDSMGMAYIPVYEDQASSTSAVPGLAAVHLSPGIDQQIGVSVVPVQMRDLEVPIRAAA